MNRKLEHMHRSCCVDTLLVPYVTVFSEADILMSDVYKTITLKI